MPLKTLWCAIDEFLTWYPECCWCQPILGSFTPGYFNGSSPPPSPSPLGLAFPKLFSTPSFGEGFGFLVEPTATEGFFLQQFDAVYVFSPQKLKHTGDYCKDEGKKQGEIFSKGFYAAFLAQWSGRFFPTFAFGMHCKERNVLLNTIWTDASIINNASVVVIIEPRDHTFDSVFVYVTLFRRKQKSSSIQSTSFSFRIQSRVKSTTGGIFSWSAPVCFLIAIPIFRKNVLLEIWSRVGGFESSYGSARSILRAAPCKLRRVQPFYATVTSASLRFRSSD